MRGLAPRFWQHVPRQPPAPCLQRWNGAGPPGWACPAWRHTAQTPAGASKAAAHGPRSGCTACSSPEAVLRFSTARRLCVHLMQSLDSSLAAAEWQMQRAGGTQRPRRRQTGCKARTCPSMPNAAMVRMLVNASEAVWLAWAKVSSSCMCSICRVCCLKGGAAPRPRGSSQRWHTRRPSALHLVHARLAPCEPGAGSQAATCHTRDAPATRMRLARPTTAHGAPAPGVLRAGACPALALPSPWRRTT